MKFSSSGAVLFVLAALPAVSLAQQGGTLKMPYERDWWGHAGLSVGEARLKTDCAGGFSCDLKDQHLRAYVGGRFNNTWGGEVAYLDFGDFSRGNGQTDAKGINFSLIGGVPIGANSSVFGKLGLGYTRTEVTAAPGTGIQTGNANGWGPSIGIGGQIGITPNWAVRLDLDRYRFKLPEGRNTVDTFTVGVQYTFR